MSLFFKRSSERLYKKSPMKESWYAFVPNQTHFGALCGFADDIVAGGQGFGMHPHENMEISTIVLSGSQAHRDNTGSEGIINEYSIQTMSAGKGIMHSEYNASPTLSFHSFQIWVYPKNKDVMPRHEKFNFQPDEKLNKIMLALSPDRRDKTALINQDAFLSVCRLEAKNAVHYVLHQEGNGCISIVPAAR